MDDLEFLIGSGHAVPSESEETMRPRRNHTPAFKAKRALTAVKGGRTPAQPAEQFDVHPTRSRSPTTIELDQSAIAIIGEEQPASLSAELHVHQNGNHVADAAVEQACTEQHDPGLPPLNPSSERSSLRSTPSAKRLI